MNNPPRLFSKSYILLCLAHLLHAFAFWIFVYLPVYLEDLGANKTMIGWIMGTATVSSLIFRPIIGTRLDISGRRVVLAFGGTLQALACFLYLTIDQLGSWVYVVRALHGIGIGTIFSSFLAIASDIVPVQRRTEGLAIWGMWGLLPMAIGPKMTETLIEGWGFSAAFLVAAIMAVGTLVCCLAIPDSHRKSETSGPSGFFRVVAYRRLRIVWILTLFFGAMIAAYFNFIAVFAKEEGLAGLNSFFVFYAIAAVGIRTLGAKYPDRYGIGPFLKVTIAVYGLGIFLIGWANGPLLFSVAGFLCGFGHGYLFPILNMIVVHRCQDADRGAAVTTYAAALDLGMFLGAPSMGWFAEAVSTAAMFHFSALIFIIVGILFFFVDPKFRSVHVKSTNVESQ